MQRRTSFLFEKIPHRNQHSLCFFSHFIFKNSKMNKPDLKKESQTLFNFFDYRSHHLLFFLSNFLRKRNDKLSKIFAFVKKKLDNYIYDNRNGLDYLLFTK
jgi:hypothetical protein